MNHANKQAQTLGLVQLLNLVSTSEKAIYYFEKVIWSGGVRCPRCQKQENLTQQKDIHKYWCKSCRQYFNVKTGTPMENSNVSLQKWVIAIYLMMTSRKGVSSIQLSKELDITQKSAWFMTQRIRESFDVVGSNKLKGIVEVDETYIGGKEKNKHSNKKTKHNQGRSTKTKTAIVGMRSRSGKVKATVMAKVNSKNIQAYIDENVELGVPYQRMRLLCTILSRALIS